MGKKFNIAYVALCLVICALPLVGMIVAPTTDSAENKELAPAPALTTADGGINFDFFDEFNSWFDDHFAGRSQLVDADAHIQQALFGASSAERVVSGTDGWLYFQGTVDDYLGQNVMSERKAFNAANNISLIQRQVEGQGADFLLAVVPNKNSLYGQNMPAYLQTKASDTKSYDVFAKAVAKEGIPTTDLFAAFKAQNECLYLHQDSHWTNKGAALAYNQMMTALGKEHDTFGTASVIREKTHVGDIAKMLYPVSAQPEWNENYQIDDTYKVISQTDEPEPLLVTTRAKGTDKSGRLVMFRDSFGTTLLPFFASQYYQAAFSWNMPLPVDSLLESQKPTTVVCETVERNIGNYADFPALMSAPEVDDLGTAKCTGQSTVALGTCEYDAAYQCVSGTVVPEALKASDRIFVQVEHGGATRTYEAFTTTDDGSDNAFTAYFKQGAILPGDNVRVFIGTPEKATCVAGMTAK